MELDYWFIVIQEYKERLQASEEEEQCLLQASELKQKMERARDAQISNLKTAWELQEKGKHHNYYQSTRLLIYHININL